MNKYTVGDTVYDVIRCDTVQYDNEVIIDRGDPKDMSLFSKGFNLKTMFLLMMYFYVL